MSEFSTPVGVTPRRPPGRPRFQPTDEQRAGVRRLRLIGLTYRGIAHVLGIHVQTLRQHFAHELEHSTRDLLGLLAAKAYELALAGNSHMLEFLLSRRAGWVESEVVNIPPGQPASAGSSGWRVRGR